MGKAALTCGIGLDYRVFTLVRRADRPFRNGLSFHFHLCILFHKAAAYR